MNLLELQSQIMDNVGPAPAVSSPQVIRLVNRAVEHLVNIVEQTAQLYNMAAAAKTISVVSGTLTYQINTTGVKPRKILHVERTDVSAGNITCVIVPWRQRNLHRGRHVWSDGGHSGGRPRIYIRRDSDGDWYLGFPSDPKATMTIDVYYAPRVTTLSDAIDEPTEIPEQFHELIVMRATMMLLQQNSRDSRFWREAYTEQVQLMLADLERWNRTGPRVKQFYVSAK